MLHTNDHQHTTPSKSLVFGNNTPPPTAHQQNENAAFAAEYFAAQHQPSAALAAPTTPHSAVLPVESFRDESETLSLIVATLNTSLIFYVKGIVEVAEHQARHHDAGEVVSVEEATEFVALMVEIVSSKPEAAQQLLFDAAQDIFETLGNLVAATKRYAPPPKVGEAPKSLTDVQESFAKLRIVSINAVKDLTSLTTGISPHLGKLTASALSRMSFVESIMAILTAPTGSVDLRVATVEALFVLVMKCGVSLLPLSAVDQLLGLAPIEPDETVRRYCVATLRDVAEHQPKCITAGVSTMLRLSTVDNCSDVRTLALDTVGCYLRSLQQETDEKVDDSYLDAKIQELLEVMKVLLLRFEATAESDDVLEAAARVFDCTLMLASRYTAEEVFRFAAQHNMHTYLLSCLDKSPHIGAIAAKALRVLVERAPTHINIAPRLVTSSTLAIILKALMELSSGNLPSEPLPTRIMCVELSTIIGMMLIFSPANRSKFVHELQAFPMWSQTVASRLHESFACAAVDYFEDMLLVDECGVVMNAVDSVDWLTPQYEGDAEQPSQESLRMIFDTQELRRKTPAGLSNWIELAKQRELTAADPKRGYLAMVMLGYICVTSLNRAHRQAPAEKATRGSVFASPQMVKVAAPTQQEHITNMFVRDASPAFEQDYSVAPQSVPTSSSFMANATNMHMNEASGVHGGGRAASAARRNLHMFPVAPRPAATRPSTAAHQQHHSPTTGEDTIPIPDQAASGYTLLRSEFEACMKLAVEFSEAYINKREQQLNPSGSSVAGARAGKYAKNGQGLMMKASKVPKLQNPFATVNVDRGHLRAWSVQCVKEGDLFFFSVPLQALTASVLDAVIAKARRHATLIKKQFLTTPQTQRERRWFLQDMQGAIMPRIITHLKGIHKVLATNGDQQVQVALSVLPAIRNRSDQEKVLYCGNLPTVLQFLHHHYSKTIPGSSGSPSGDHHHHAQPSSSSGPGASSLAESQQHDTGRHPSISNASFTSAGMNNSSFAGLNRQGSVLQRGTGSFAAAPQSPRGVGSGTSFPSAVGTTRTGHYFDDVAVSPRSDVSSGDDDFEDRY